MNIFQKKLLDISDKFLSNQTGFIHFNYKKDAEKYDTISVLENFCFCHLLLSSKEIGNINLANNLLKKLFHFFTIKEGFPIYLHEYPKCNFYAVNIEILNVLYWIEKDSSKVLESELKINLNDIIDNLISFCFLHENKFSPSLFFKVIAIKAKRNNKKTDIKKYFLNKYLLNKKDLSNFIFALQVIDPLLDDIITKSILRKIFNLFHIKLNTYPALFAVFNEKKEEKKDFIDFIMFYVFEDHNKLDDLLTINPSCLFLTILKPINIKNIDICDTQDKNESLKVNDMVIQKNEASLFSFLESFEKKLPKRGDHIFRIILDKDKNKKNSFVLENFNGSIKNKLLNEKSFISQFTFSNEIFLDDFELVFYIENNAQILINNKKATSFNKNDKILIDNQKSKLEISFPFVHDIKFTGHIFRSNRLSQICDIKNKTISYDYMIAIRTIKRSKNAKLNVKYETLII